MKKISFVQSGVQVGPKEENSYYLPYSVGRLWAFSKKQEKINKNIKLDTFIFKRDSIQKTCDIISDSDLLGISFYVWNDKYNKELGLKFKKNNPNAVIIAGGPELPVTDKNIFKEYPFIDFVIKKEAEIVFVNLLEELIENNYDLTKEYITKGLLINKKGDCVDTGNSYRIVDLDILPSPYLDGSFATLIEENPDITLSCIIETNRGCPYQCTFCDWGSLTYSKVKKFKLETVLEEIEWVGKNKAHHLSFADANFGIFYDRDNIIADKVLECQNKYGYPKSVTVAFAKNQKNELMIPLIKKLTRTGLVISTQTLNEDVLDIIKRKNTNQHIIKKVFKEAERQGIPVETEVIIPLPGETIETWKQNFYKLFELNNHTGISVYILQALKNSPLTLNQLKEYELTLSPNYNSLMRTDVKYDDDIAESIDLVISTKHMPFEDLLESMAFTWLVLLLHATGFSTYISRVLNKKYSISYEQFYEKLLPSMLSNCKWLRTKREEYLKIVRKLLLEGKTESMIYGNHQIPLSSATIFLLGIYEVTAAHNHDMLLETIKDCTLKEFPHIEIELVNEIIKFTDSVIVRYEDIANFPKSKKFKYDIINYLLHDEDLYKEVTYDFWIEDHIYSNISKQVFYDYFHYRRRVGFGMAKIKTQG